MNKEQLITILQSSLLNFDGVKETELINQHGLNSELARIGCQLCSYLKSKEINLEVLK